MIDRGDIRQAIDRCSNIWASLPGAGYGQFEHKAGVGRANQRRLTARDWCMSRVTGIIPVGLFASSSACHGLLIITVILITYKAQRDKNARESVGERAAITDMQMRQRDVAGAWCKYTKELADAKAENDALHDVAAGRRRLHISNVSQREVTAASGADNAASRLADTAERDHFTLREADHYKNNWKEPGRILMSAVDRVAHIDGQLMQLLWAIHTRFQRSINA